MVGLLLVCGLGVTSATPAVADNCAGTAYCYAGVVWEVDHPSGFRGGKVTLRSNCMIVASLGAFSIEHYFETRLNRFTSNFIQGGIRVGRAPVGDFYHPNPTRYWAENKASGYFGHYFNTETLGVPRVISARLPNGATNDWDVWFDNVVNHDVSVNNFTGPARYMYAGTKLQDGDDDTRTVGSTSRLYFYNLGGAITPQWQGSSSAAGISLTPGNNYSHWADPSWWAQMGRNAC